MASRAPPAAGAASAGSASHSAARVVRTRSEKSLEALQGDARSKKAQPAAEREPGWDDDDAEDDDGDDIVVSTVPKRGELDSAIDLRRLKVSGPVSPALEPGQGQPPGEVPPASVGPAAAAAAAASAAGPRKGGQQQKQPRASEDDDIRVQVARSAADSDADSDVVSEEYESGADEEENDDVGKEKATKPAAGGAGRAHLSEEEKMKQRIRARVEERKKAAGVPAHHAPSAPSPKKNASPRAAAGPPRGKTKAAQADDDGNEIVVLTPAYDLDAARGRAAANKPAASAGKSSRPSGGSSDRDGGNNEADAAGFERPRGREAAADDGAGSQPSSGPSPLGMVRTRYNELEKLLLSPHEQTQPTQAPADRGTADPDDDVPESSRGAADADKAVLRSQNPPALKRSSSWSRPAATVARMPSSSSLGTTDGADAAAADTDDQRQRRKIRRSNSELVAVATKPGSVPPPRAARRAGARRARRKAGTGATGTSAARGAGDTSAADDESDDAESESDSESESTSGNEAGAGARQRADRGRQQEGAGERPDEGGAEDAEDPDRELNWRLRIQQEQAEARRRSEEELAQHQLRLSHTYGQVVDAPPVPEADAPEDRWYCGPNRQLNGRGWLALLVIYVTGSLITCGNEALGIWVVYTLSPGSIASSVLACFLVALAVWFISTLASRVSPIHLCVLWTFVRKGVVAYFVTLSALVGNAAGPVLGWAYWHSPSQDPNVSAERAANLRQSGTIVAAVVGFGWPLLVALVLGLAPL